MKNNIFVCLILGIVLPSFASAQPATLEECQDALAQCKEDAENKPNKPRNRGKNRGKKAKASHQPVHIVVNNHLGGAAVEAEVPDRTSILSECSKLTGERAQMACIQALLDAAAGEKGDRKAPKPNNPLTKCNDLESEAAQIACVAKLGEKLSTEARGQAIPIKAIEMNQDTMFISTASGTVLVDTKASANQAAGLNAQNMRGFKAEMREVPLRTDATHSSEDDDLIPWAGVGLGTAIVAVLAGAAAYGASSDAKYNTTDGGQRVLVRESERGSNALFYGGTVGGGAFLVLALLKLATDGPTKTQQITITPTASPSGAGAVFHMPW